MTGREIERAPERIVPDEVVPPSGDPFDPIKALMDEWVRKIRAAPINVTSRVVTRGDVTVKIHVDTTAFQDEMRRLRQAMYAGFVTSKFARVHLRDWTES